MNTKHIPFFCKVFFTSPLLHEGVTPGLEGNLLDESGRLKKKKKKSERSGAKQS